MSRKPLGDGPMSNAERCRRRRQKAKALRDAALTPDLVAVTNGSETVAQRIPNSQAPGKFDSAVESDHIAAPLRYGDPHNGKSGPDYPRMLYHANGRTLVVATPEEHEALTADGWGTIPLAVHRQRPVWHHGIPQPNSPFARPLPRW